MNSDVWKNIGFCSCPAMVLRVGKCKDGFVVPVLFMPVAVSLQSRQILKLVSAPCKGLPVSTSAQEQPLATANLEKLQFRPCFF